MRALPAGEGTGMLAFWGESVPDADEVQPQFVQGGFQVLAFVGRAIAFGLLLEHRQQVDGMLGLIEIHVGLLRDRIGKDAEPHRPLQIERAHQEGQIGRRQRRPALAVCEGGVSAGFLAGSVASFSACTWLFQSSSMISFFSFGSSDIVSIAGS